MDTSHERVALTAQEKRVVAELEAAAGGRRSRMFAMIAARGAGPGKRRMRDVTAVLLLVAGVSLMVVTFTRWPAVAMVGVVMQACALWWGLTRLAPRVDAWASAKQQARFDHRSARPR